MNKDRPLAFAGPQRERLIENQRSSLEGPVAANFDGVAARRFFHSVLQRGEGVLGFPFVPQDDEGFVGMGEPCFCHLIDGRLLIVRARRPKWVEQDSDQAGSQHADGQHAGGHTNNSPRPPGRRGRDRGGCRLRFDRRLLELRPGIWTRP